MQTIQEPHLLVQASVRSQCGRVFEKFCTGRHRNSRKEDRPTHNRTVDVNPKLKVKGYSGAWHFCEKMNRPITQTNFEGNNYIEVFSCISPGA